MKQLAERTAGHFTQINPDEPIGWRAFDLSATLNAPRMHNIKVLDNDSKLTFLTFTDSASDGEEICAMTRLEKGKVLPGIIRIEGDVNGGHQQTMLKVESVSKDAAHLPRTWAKLEIERLLASPTSDERKDSAKLKKQIVDLSNRCT